MTKKVRKKKPPREVSPLDSYYMGLAFVVSTRSKDPSTQCGAIIVGENNVPISMGYNGVPRKIDDNDVDWSRSDKYDFIDHAEENALHHGRYHNLEKATIYISALPCKRCMKSIVRHEIERVVYFPMTASSGSMLDLDDKEKERILKIAKMGKVKIEEFNGNLNWMRDQIALFEAMGIFK